MITVHYRPYEALRPIHIALMAAAEADLPLNHLPAMFGLPDLFLQHACDDLISWGFARSANGKIILQQIGKACVSVWVDTEQRGFWKFSEPLGWELGKGVFFFRSPLLFLNDAGFDPETGQIISSQQASVRLRSFFTETEKFERDFQIESVTRELKAIFRSDADPHPKIANWFGRPQNRLQLNQLSRVMKTSLHDCNKDSGPLVQSARQANRIIDEQRKLAENRLRDEQRSMLLVHEALMAKWLSARTGLLRQVAENVPGSIFIKSDFDPIPSSPPVKAKKQIEPQKKQALEEPQKKPESIFDILFKLFK